MNVEGITDTMPAGSLGIARDNGLDMDQKIFLCPRGSGVGSQQLSRDHITAENESTSAVTRVLKLAALHFSGGQR